tara:strand:+ start:2733 stop:3095 length:363 start_codon:yes stop_codon:yes gene_type:complete
MTLTWKVDTMTVTYAEGGLSDVVTIIAWRVTATDGTFVDPDGATRPLSASTVDSIEITPPDPNNFTPYNNITESQAVGWVKDALGDDRVAAVEAQVSSAVEEKKTPTSGTPPLPWDEDES